MTSPTPNWSTVRVRENYARFAGGEIQGTNSVSFTPNFDQARDTVGKITILPETITLPLVNGVLDGEVPATNDPDIDRVNFTMRVKENFTGGREYSIYLPAEKPEVILSECERVAPNTGAVVVRREGVDLARHGYRAIIQANNSQVITDEKGTIVAQTLDAATDLDFQAWQNAFMNTPNRISVVSTEQYDENNNRTWTSNIIFISTDTKFLDIVPEEYREPWMTEEMQVPLAVTVLEQNDVYQALLNLGLLHPDYLPDRKAILKKRTEVLPGIWGYTFVEYDPNYTTE